MAAGEADRQTAGGARTSTGAQCALCTSSLSCSYCLRLSLSAVCQLLPWVPFGVARRYQCFNGCHGVRTKRKGDDTHSHAHTLPRPVCLYWASLSTLSHPLPVARVCVCAGKMLHLIYDTLFCALAKVFHISLGPFLVWHLDSLANLHL